jgi:hypothetical protein
MTTLSLPTARTFRPGVSARLALTRHVGSATLLAAARTAVVLAVCTALAGGFVASLTSAPTPDSANVVAASARCTTGCC